MLLDTDVMVDVLRGFPAAVAWLNTLGSTPVGLPGLVAMELLQGCRDLAEQQRVEGELRRFTLHWPTEADCLRALGDFAAYRLSHNLGVLDALIGETAIGLARPLATFNIKHYGVISALKTIQPY
jgi:predicted nucleic acid-binding protein